MVERRLITSLSNSSVKEIRALKSRKARGSTGLFKVEGLHHVGSVIEAGWEVDRLIYAPRLLSGDFADSLLEDARRLGFVIQPVSVKVMESLTDKENPQGILAVVKQRIYGFEQSPEIRSCVALVSPQDPGNVGTILRTVDAVDVDTLFILEGGVDTYHPTCVRASMGALFWKPVVRASFAEFTRWAKEMRVNLIGTSAHGEMDYWDFETDNSPWALVFGSEQKGLSQEQLDACDARVFLPMRGRVSSLNLSVAAGVLLYAIKKKGR